MLKSKSDYKFVDVSDIEITGKILPIREKENPGSGRFVTAEDLAFVTEALIERSDIGTSRDWYSVYGDNRTQGSSYTQTMYSPMGSFEADVGGFKNGVGISSSSNEKHNWMDYNGSLRFSDIVKKGNEYLLESWIRSVEDALNVITLASSCTWSGIIGENYTVMDPQFDFSRIKWIKFPLEEWEYREPIYLQQKFLNKMTDWEPGDGSVWETTANSRPFLIYSRMSEIFRKIKLIRKVMVASPQLHANGVEVRGSEHRETRKPVQIGYYAGYSWYNHLTAAPGYVIGGQDGLHGTIKSAYFILVTYSQNKDRDLGVRGEYMNAYELNLEQSDDGDEIWMCGHEVVGIGGSLSGMTLHNEFNHPDSGTSGSAYGSIDSGGTYLYEKSFLGLEYVFRTNW